MSYFRLGVDVGGTFTDLLLVDDETGDLFRVKTPSTPADPSEGVLTGVTRISDEAGAAVADIRNILHGTTVATNAVLESKGARVGLLTTVGFKQILHLARSQTPGPLAGWIIMIKPDPPASLADTREIVERMDARGDTLTPVDVKQAEEAIRDLVESGVETLTIGFINSYISSRHEEEVGEIVERLYPGFPITLSSHVLPEFREYERTLTACMNSYVRPKVASYVEHLQTELKAVGASADVNILRSDAGLMTTREAARNPIYGVLSGPSGGVAGALYVARKAGYDNILTFDMGGTSTDVSLCLGGAPTIGRETAISHFRLRVPSVDVHTVGAGGGSIAHVPELTKALRVGPQSAGAEPGPAAYGKGGTDPTVTDANVVVGHLPPQLLGGEMQLDVEAARTAVQTIADAIGLPSVEDAAEGILAIVNENMAGALRVVSVQRGHDPREFALVAYGGAGPMHANAVARIMGSFPVIVPPAPGLLCALGDIVADFRDEFARTYIRVLDDAEPDDVASILEELGERAQQWLTNEGIAEELRSISYVADMRYHGQGYEIPVSVTPGELRSEGLGQLDQRFNALHEQHYGFRMYETRSEIVNLRAVGFGAAPKPELPEGGEGGYDASAAVVDEHEIVFEGGRHSTKVYDRSKLEPGNTFAGPAIVTEFDATTVVLPGYEARVDTYFNILITPSAWGSDEMAITHEKPRIADIPTDVEVDPVTLDIIEGALKSARFEMDAVLFRSAMSPVIREQHDEFPMITDPNGRMIVGQFGAYINEMMADWEGGIFPGDVILTSDPFKCSASISHTNDWLVLVPIFFEDELVGWSSQFGHQMDCGGPLPGSLPTGARTIFEEGLIIPPLKIIERGENKEDVLKLIFNNMRLPEMNRADLFAIVAGCRAGERCVVQLCERFGKETYLAACQALLDRTYEAMRKLILVAIPEEPQTFEDWIDDDGLGNGPFKMKLTIWREGDHAFFDWSGTDPQALGPVNFYLSEGMFKMFIGIYLIMVNDPQILFNDGFYPLLHVVMPKGSLLNPRFPAALGCRTHALARQFDVLGGALCKQAPELNTAAGYGTSPYMLYSGWGDKGDFFYSMEILYGGIPGRPIGDGMDGHSWWPLFENIPTEYLEAYYPLRIDGYTTVTDSGGPGFHRGGNGVEKRYVYLEPGEVSIHDDRWLTSPWGVLGGWPGQRSSKLLQRADGSEERLPSKCDRVEVNPGDMLVYRTAGGGGWKDRLDRPVEAVVRDVAFGLVSRGLAKEGYGVVIGDDGQADEGKTEAERARQREERGEALAFDYGPPLGELLLRCKDETGLDPPTLAQPLRWSPLEPGEEALARVREGDGMPAPV